MAQTTLAMVRFPAYIRRNPKTLGLDSRSPSSHPIKET